MPDFKNSIGVTLATFALIGAALIFRIGLLGTHPSFDELYHLLAARGWLETGRPTILDGEYARTEFFTALVAAIFHLTGESSLVMGRMVSVLAGVLIPPVLFLWLHRRVGWAVALSAAGFAVLWPAGIDEAQTLRFYAWHVLSFLLAASLVFEATESTGYRRIVCGALSIICLSVAFYLQVTTVLGVVGILLWVIFFCLLPMILARPNRWLILGGLAVVGLAVLSALVMTGILQDLWQFYRWVPQWARKSQNDITFYHTLIQALYPTFWPLFPVAVLIAYNRAPRLTAFCTTLFATIFLLQSVGGMKAERYLSYAMPFFFVIVSLALVTTLPAIGRYVARASKQINITGHASITAGLVLAAALFALLANPFFERSLDGIQGRGHSAARLANIDWSSYPALVADWPSPEFLITGRELQTILYAGDYDVLIEPSRLTEVGDGSEFSVDHRTGRPVIKEAESIEMLLRCHPNGMVVGERFWWYNRGWGANIGPLFATTGRAFELRTKGDLVAVRWFGGSSDPAACAQIPIKTAS